MSGLTLLSLIINISNSDIWHSECLFCYFIKAWITSTLHWMDAACIKIQVLPGCNHVMGYESLPLFPFPYSCEGQFGNIPPEVLIIKWCSSQGLTDMLYSLAVIPPALHRDCQCNQVVLAHDFLWLSEEPKKSSWISCNLSWNVSTVTKRCGMWANGVVKTSLAQPLLNFSRYSCCSPGSALEADIFPL